MLKNILNIFVYRTGRLCGGAQEISGTKAPLSPWVGGWKVLGMGGWELVGWVVLWGVGGWVMW